MNIFIFTDGTGEVEREVCHSAYGGFRGNLKELYHGKNVLRAIVKRRGRKQHHLVSLTQSMQEHIVICKLITIFMSLVHDDQKLLIRVVRFLKFQSFMYGAASENHGIQIEINPIFFVPLIIQMGRRNDDHLFTQVVCHGRSDDTFAQAHNV